MRAVRTAIEALAKVIYLFNTSSRIRTEGEQAVLRLPNGNEDQLPTLLFELIDPDHMPGDSGTVEHTADPARPGTLEGLEGYDASIHIEQMHHRDFWAGIGSGSYSFISEKQEGHRLQLTRLSEKETNAHFV